VKAPLSTKIKIETLPASHLITHDLSIVEQQKIWVEVFIEFDPID
jgi:hypothetical protein